MFLTILTNLKNIELNFSNRSVYTYTTTCILQDLFIGFICTFVATSIFLFVALLNVCDVNINPILNLSANTITLSLNSFLFYAKFLKKCYSLSITHKVFGMKHFNIISSAQTYRISNHKLIVLNLYC